MTRESLLSLMALLVLLLFSGESRGAGTSAKPGVLEALHKGEIICNITSVPGSQTQRAVAVGVVEASGAQVFDIIKDYERYQEFMPGVKSSHILSKEGPQWRVETTMKVPFPLQDLHYILRIDHEETKPGYYRSEWTLEGGNMRHHEGHWVLEPWRDGEATLVMVSLMIEPMQDIPKGLIKKANSVALPKIFQAVRDRATGLAKERG